MEEILVQQAKTRAQSENQSDRSQNTNTVVMDARYVAVPYTSAHPHNILASIVQPVSKKKAVNTSKK